MTKDISTRSRIGGYMSNRVATDDTLKEVVSAINGIAQAIRGGGTIYGFHINGNESSQDDMVTYIEGAVGMEPAYMDFESGEFNWGSWKDAFFLPRPCMVKYDGTVDYYLDENDYTKKADGTASDIANVEYGGNAMMEWGQNGKKIWMCIKPSADGHSADVYIADYKVDDDYHCWPFINNQGVEVDHFYTRIYNGSQVTGTDEVARLRSLSGQMPCHNTSGTTELTLAKANNPADDQLWNTLDWGMIMMVNMLLILMAKSTNMQGKYGYGWNGYDESHPTGEGYYGIKAAGAGNDKGLFYGSNLSTASGDIVKVFGMENWWGNLWERFTGLIADNGVWKVKYTHGMQDGSAVEGYNTNGDGYINIGNSPMTKDGESGVGQGYIYAYIKQMLFDASGSMLPVAMGDGASSSTYYGDVCYFNDDVADRYPSFGSRVSDGTFLGAFAVYVNSAVSSSSWCIGAGVSLKPLAGGGTGESSPA